MIPITRVEITPEDEKAVAEVLRTGYLVQGPQVEGFEAELSDRLAGADVVVVSNGTAALHLALLAADIGPGDLVAVSAYSWPASANVIEVVGATPVFIDIDPATYNISEETIEATTTRLTDSGGIESLAAIMPVHAFGQVAPMAAVRRLAEAAEAIVVEDAACALGAELDGAPAGTLGDIGCFSFHPRKVITTGEGGAVVLPGGSKLTEKVAALRNHGQWGPERSFAIAGLNYRMPDPMAALGRSQLARLDALLAERREQASRYADLLAGTGLLVPQVVNPEQTTVQAYVVLLPEGVDRAGVIDGMQRAGVQAMIGTIAIPFTPYYAERYGVERADLPGLARVDDGALALPCFPGLTAEQQEEIAGHLIELIA